MALLDIKNLTLEIETTNGWVKALDKINLSIDAKEVRALVGESGSGKSLIVKSIVGALNEGWRIRADRLNWRGIDLTSLSARERRQITREDISVIFQNPSNSLDPTATLGDQLEEAIPEHLIGKGWFWERAKRRKQIVTAQLHKVGIKNHETVINSFPHQIPDDICQKFMIAMALASEPTLLIADDPTKGLETTTKIQILKLLTRLNKIKDLSILFVSHDLLAIASIADTMTVLYCGQTVEGGPLMQLKNRPLHPYTKALLDSAPSFRKDLESKSELNALEGTIPTLQHLPAGCRLGPRCPRAQKECVRHPDINYIQNHYFSCHFPLLGSKL